MLCYVLLMERVGVRELRQHASRYLSQVKAGKSVEVTERGRLIALLVPPDADRSARQRLASSGRLILADRPFRLPERTAPPAGGPSTAAALQASREDRG
jgi:prevent-host-death family protein